MRERERVDRERNKQINKEKTHRVRQKDEAREGNDSSWQGQKNPEGLH